VTRGDIVTVAMTGDFGEPCPALVVQADPFDQTGTIAVLLISGMLVDAPLIRLPLAPTPQNGLIKPSQVQIDKAMSVQRHRVGAVIGRLDGATMLAVTRSLALFLGIA
jgi:mRNA interferase MazF